MASKPASIVAWSRPRKSPEMLPGSSLSNTRPRRARVFSEDEPARLFLRKNGKENTEYKE